MVATPNRTLRNVLWNWGTLACTIAVTFLLSPYVVRSLGNASYGLWVLLGSLVGYLGLLDFGVRSAVTRYVAKLHAEAADADASRIASTAVAIFSIMGAAAVVGAAVLAAGVGHWFEIPSAHWTTARIVLILSALSVAVSLLGGVFGGIIVGLQRFDVNGQIEISVVILRAAATYFALRAGFGLVALAVLQLASSLARTGVSGWFARRLYPGLRLRLGVWDPVAFRQIFSFSFYTSLLVLSSSLILYSDSVVIGAFLPVAAVTFFAIAANLTNHARAPISGIVYPLTPRTSALQGRGLDQVRDLMVGSSRMSTLLILPIAVTFFLRGEAFIGLWMGRQYAETSGQILRILSFALVSWTTMQATLHTAMGLSRHKGLVPFSLAESLLNLGLSVLWVRQIGLTGVAWGTTLPSLVSALLVMPWYARRLVGVPLLEYWFQVWLRPALAVIPFAVGTILVEAYWPARGLVSYFAGVVAVLPLAAVGAWVLALNANERKQLRVAIKNRFGMAPRGVGVSVAG